jgi:hypothetical protein
MIFIPLPNTNGFHLVCNIPGVGEFSHFGSSKEEAMKSLMAHVKDFKSYLSEYLEREAARVQNKIDSIDGFLHEHSLKDNQVKL